LKNCPVSEGKKAYTYYYDDKMIRLSSRRLTEDTAGFKDTYRYRAGVEATMSEYDRRTGVKHLRVRGLKAVCFAATLKAIGVNIFRAARFKFAQQRGVSRLGDYDILLYWEYIGYQRTIFSRIRKNETKPVPNGTKK
ncbi:MAG: transposase, partial [Desulfobulbaceae bacterium]|nr:transposase [Desulfobulbaceae bacterium]